MNVIEPCELNHDVTAQISVSDVGSVFIVFRDRDSNGPTMIDLDEARLLHGWLTKLLEPPASFVTKAIEELRTVEREIGVPSEALTMIGCSSGRRSGGHE